MGIETAQIGRILSMINDGKISEQDIRDHINKISKIAPSDVRQDYLYQLKEGVIKLADIIVDEVIIASNKTEEYLPKNVILTRKEVIDLYKISSSTFTNWVKNGLKVKKIERRVYVDKKDLEIFTNKIN